jgi:hypothetical protein
MHVKEFKSKHMMEYIKTVYCLHYMLNKCRHEIEHTVSDGVDLIEMITK